jgi:thiamine-monophosphate kinase
VAQSGDEQSRLTLRDIGEFGLIDRLMAIVGPGDAAIGIGDDAAALGLGGPDYLLATVDMMVEGVHFRLPSSPATDIGRRAIAVNVSDIAAMGGEPRHALISIAVSPDLELTVLEEIYQGLADEAEQYGTSIIGGNTSRTTGPLAIDIVLLGTVPKGEIVRRSGARTGDVLAVTGTLGERAALHLARDAGLDLRPWREWVGTAAVPRPRVAAARALASRHLAHAMLDLSDGLAGDVHHLCAASRVGAVVDAEHLPVSPQVNAICRALGENPVDLALGGGEDYELLVALAPTAVDLAREIVAPLPLHVVGDVVDADEGITLAGPRGRQGLSAAQSWRHF